MKYSKIIKDCIVKFFWNGDDIVPRGLFELSQYFRSHGPIKFSFHKEDGYIIATSQNFKYGSIITQGVDQTELDKNVKDAILTAFEIPSAYKKEANIKSVGEAAQEYVLA